MQSLQCLRTQALAASLIFACLLIPQALAHDVEKELFLIIEKSEVIASNTRLGRFDRLKLSPRERIVDYGVANAVAVVVTNRRLVAYGALHGGWHSRRTVPGERLISIEVGDYSATLLTSDRILNYSGRSGAWSDTRR